MIGFRPLLLLILISTAPLLACAFISDIAGGEESEPTSSPVLDSIDSPAADEPSAVVDCLPVNDENALFIFEDIEHMNLLTPFAGGGRRPKLAWDPVLGAEYYAVVLFDQDEDPYWAWQGAEAAVYAGGLTEPPPEDGEGAIVTPCMTWIATAYDGDGVPIAAGGPRSLSP